MDLVHYFIGVVIGFCISFVVFKSIKDKEKKVYDGRLIFDFMHSDRETAKVELIDWVNATEKDDILLKVEIVLPPERI